MTDEGTVKFEMHSYNLLLEKADLVGWVLWLIYLYRLFNAKSIFIQIVLFQTIQFSMSKQFNCLKHFYFKLFSLFKQF